MTLTTAELESWCISRCLSTADAAQLRAVFEERDEALNTIEADTLALNALGVTLSKTMKEQDEMRRRYGELAGAVLKRGKQERAR